MVLGNCTYLHELYRLISSCVIPDMVSLPNPGLNDALDSQEQTGALLSNRQRVALDGGDQLAKGSHDYYGKAGPEVSIVPLGCCLINPLSFIPTATLRGRYVHMQRSTWPD